MRRILVLKHFFLFSFFLMGSVLIAQEVVIETEETTKKEKKSHNTGFGLVLKGSTNGIGADLAYQFHRNMDLRIGYETFDYTTIQNFSANDINLSIAAALKAETFSLLFNYYLTRHFFFTAGAMYNNFKTTATGKPVEDYVWGDVIISKENLGSIDVTVAPKVKIAPYFGMGIGRIVGVKHRISLAAELGLLYIGSPDIALAATGILEPTVNPVYDQEAILEEELSQFKFYPVLKISMGIKLSKQH